MRLLLPVLLMLVAVGVAACVTTRSDGTSRSMDRIEPEELAEAGSYSTAYELVQRLRPQWLRKRGRSNVGFEGSIKVYVDGARFGTAEALTQVQASNVEAMTYLRPSQASDRFGMNHDQGAILVTLK